MTVCYELPVPLGTYTIGYDRDAEWHSHWGIYYTRKNTGPRAFRRYSTYTEARRVLARIKRSHHQ